jgi:O-antigen/teichoic acid export membrane protein
MSKLAIHTSKTLSNFLVDPDFRKYFTNTSWLIAQNVFCSMVQFVVGIYVARYLNPEYFGLLSYAISFVALFSAIASLGLDSLIVRELVNTPARQDILLGTAFILKIAGGLLVFIMLAAAMLFSNNDSFTNMLIFIIASGLLIQSLNIIQFYFEAKVLCKYYAISQFTVLTVVSVARLVFVYMRLPLIYFAIATVMEGGLLSVGLIFFYTKQKNNIFNWTFNFKLAGELLKNSWPLVFSGLVISIYMRIDQVMLKQILDSEAVGQYAVAVKLSEVWYFIPMAICTSLFPAILNAKKKSELVYNERVQKLYDLMIWMAIIITVPVSFWAKDIVVLLFGKQYSYAGNILPIHIWAAILVFYGIVKSKWEISENMQKVGLVCTSVGAFFNIGLNLILIPKFYGVGAAYATLLAHCISGLLVPLFHHRNRQAVHCFFKSIIPIHLLRQGIVIFNGG